MNDLYLDLARLYIVVVSLGVVLLCKAWAWMAKRQIQMRVYTRTLPMGKQTGKIAAKFTIRIVAIATAAIFLITWFLVWMFSANGMISNVYPTIFFLVATVFVVLYISMYMLHKQPQQEPGR